jgi:hypothetical protein
MKLYKIFEFAYIIIILVFLAFLSIFFVIAMEINSFLVNIATPWPTRIFIFALLGLVFFLIINHVKSKIDDFTRIV